MERSYFWISYTWLYEKCFSSITDIMRFLTLTVYWMSPNSKYRSTTYFIGRDGDLDLLPLWVTVGSQLKVFFFLIIYLIFYFSNNLVTRIQLIDQHSIYLHLIQFQHIYWSVNQLTFFKIFTRNIWINYEGWSDDNLIFV